MSDQATNRKVVLASRPEGLPLPENFRLEECPISRPAEDQILCRTIYLSLDPYMRGMMKAGKSYVEPLNPGDTLCGGTVSEVIESRFSGLSPGDIVLTYDGWQEYGVSKGKSARKLDPGLAPVSTALGVLGMPGMTAYSGLLQIGKPEAGETLVVSAASGAVGSLVGQIGKLKGCRVVGIAGAEKKCEYVINDLGFDQCVSYKTDRFPEQLAAACPQGVDIYFENVGGRVTEAIIPLLNFKSRIPVCGLIANYNDTALPQGPDHLPMLLRAVLTQRVSITGFIVTDFNHLLADFLRDVGSWLAEGQIHYREDIVTGLENAPTAFIGLFSGNNFGKLLVQLDDDPTR